MKKEERLQKNWTDSSANYSKIIEDELRSFKKNAWLNLICQNGEMKPDMKILDIGTGPGFFTIILAEQGYQVTAADCTEAMIQCARINGERHGIKAKYQVADAQNLPFEDESFDLIVSRNVAWTIIDAEKAYKEWKRVLKPNGVVLIFDANWNIRLFDEKKAQEDAADLAEVKRLYPDYPLHLRTPEMEEFRRSMPMCAKHRPQWDFELLLRAGYQKIECIPSLNEWIYTEEEKIMNRSVPEFLLKAKK